MKKYLVLFLILIAYALNAQTLGSRYYWQENFSLTTSVTDTTFTDAYESCTLYCDDADIDIKVGAPDTSNVTSQSYMRIPAGRSFTYGPSTRLKRIYVKTATGTGTLYLTGIKKVSQF